MKRPRIKWTLEMLQEEALTYNSRIEFQRRNNAAYQAAYKRKVLDSICSHMTAKYIYWTKDMLQTEALKYTTRSQFQKSNYAAYQAALSRKILDDICEHMEPQHIYWTDDEIRECAMKYNTRSEFKNNHASAYSTACNRGIISDICKSMVDILTYWTDDMLRECAAKYITLSEFRKNEGSAYATACRRGIINEITNHVIRGNTGFNKEKSGILYYIKFESVLDIPIYKIGITNASTKCRINSMRVCDGYATKILKEFYFENGKECYDVEQLYHKEYKEYRYYGDNVMKNGNTELYVKDVLGLDNDYI